MERVFEAGSQQVSVAPLMKILIAWDFYRDIADDRDNTPEYEQLLLSRALRAADHQHAAETFKVPELKELPIGFHTIDEYLQSYFPLFLIETKQAIYRAREMELSEQAEVVVQAGASPKENTFVLNLDRSTNTSTFYSQGDLVLLYYYPPEDETHEQFLINQQTRLFEEIGAEVCPSMPGAKGDEKCAKDVELVDEPTGTAVSVVAPGTVDKAKELAAAKKAAQIEALLHNEEGVLIVPPDPRRDNPHHLLGFVDSTSRESISIQVLIHDVDTDMEHYLLGELEEKIEENPPSDNDGMIDLSGDDGMIESSGNDENIPYREGNVNDGDEECEMEKGDAEYELSVVDEHLDSPEYLAKQKSRRKEVMTLEQKRRRRQILLELILSRDQYRMRKAVELVSRGPNAIWFLAKVMNMTTVHREYQALMCVPDLVLRDKILLMPDSIGEGGGKSSSSSSKAMTKLRRQQRRQAMQEKERLEITPKLRSILEGMYNESQLSALFDCLKAEGVTLIQGPPGTGKTTTIMGILSVILSATIKENRKRILKLSSTTTTVVPKKSNVDNANQEIRQGLVLPSYAKKASPWLYSHTHKEWQDVQSLNAEDLEDPTDLPNASETDFVMKLAERTHTVMPKRVLVCAPSNAAIDEILKRLTSDPAKGGGIFDGSGMRYNPQVVRVGPNTHADLRRYTLDERIQQRLQATGTSVASVSREAIKSSILEDAQVVCSTLSVAGSRDLTAFADGFDTVVVDEASQGVEIAMLIPLKLNCRRLVLVGDPKQLPATVFSKVALDCGYDRSLFQRLEKRGHRVNMLSVQYRMHPKISRFPSLQFYDGQLLDAPNILESAKPVVPYYEVPLFKPVVFLDLDSKDVVEATSRVNPEEVELICQLLELLRCLFENMTGAITRDWMTRIAVISPYAEQVKLLRKSIKATFGVTEGHCPVDVNTVDGFQGREKDYVIFSAVRAQTTGEFGTTKKASIGFLADVRRMNVALTRARLNLWVVGNGKYLSGNPLWGKFWEHTNQEECTLSISHNNSTNGGVLKKFLVDYLKRTNRQDVFKTAAPGFLEQITGHVQVMEKGAAWFAEEQAAAAAKKVQE